MHDFRILKSVTIPGIKNDGDITKVIENFADKHRMENAIKGSYLI